MEMFFGIMAGVAVAWLAGRAMKLSDDQTCILITFAGAGSLGPGLALLLWLNEPVGISAHIMWIVAGAIGGAIGVAIYKVIEVGVYGTIEKFKNRPSHDHHDGH